MSLTPKQQLEQVNNPNLLSILSTIQGLPLSNEDVTSEVTAQTPVITQIAENLGVTITTPSGTNKQILQGNNANLLNIKNNAKKEGAYVWKKLTKPIMVTFVQTSYNPIKFTVSSGDIDLGSVDESWFVGIKCSYSWATAVYAFEFMENNVFVIWTADGKSHLYEGTYSYNPSNKTLTTDINPSGSFGINSSVTKQGNFLDFVVSDDPTAYPDGGEQDGYWYDKVVEGLTPEMFGYTKMAVDRFTFSTRTSTKSVDLSYTLGERAKFAILRAVVPQNATAEFDLIYMSGMTTYFTTSAQGGNYLYGGATYKNNGTNEDQVTSVKERLIASPDKAFLSGITATTYYQAGVEYELITMA